MRSTKSRAEWIEDLKNGTAKLQDCPAKLQNNYEVVHAACLSKNVEALQMAGKINSQWQNDVWLRVAAGISEEPDRAQWDICISKKYAMKPDTNTFSLLVIQRMLLDSSFKDLRIYNPDIYDKGFCLFIEEGEKAGEVDWDRCTDLSYLCRGGSTCQHPVLSTTERPTTGSCWRYSYNWHVQGVHKTNGFFLQIVELVEGQLQLGDGQVIEEDMAYDIGIPILRLEQEPGKDIEETINKLARRYTAYKSKQSDEWDEGFGRKGKANYIKALEINPDHAHAWINLGVVGGARVRGQQYSEAECYIKALEINPDYADAWTGLGHEGGGRVRGQQYSQAECYIKALEINPDDADAWIGLGAEGGGRVRGQQYSEAECYIKALEINPDHAPAWTGLGAEGGGRVRGQQYSQDDCFIKAVEIAPDYAYAWNNLGVVGGGRVRGQQYSQADCFIKANLQTRGGTETQGTHGSFCR